MAANRPRLLIVEDRATLRRLFERAFREDGLDVCAVASAEEAFERLASASKHETEPFSLVLTDLKLPGASGLDVVRAARAAHPPVPVLVLTAYGSVQAAVEAMREGALDFLEKPVELDDLQRRVREALAASLGRSEPEAPAAAWSRPGAPVIVGSHSRIRAALRLLERVAPTETTVLLLGESGTGKELFAQALHALSGRTGAFVALNCAAIPEGLVENELFGHEKGSFTGADRRQAGRFEMAHGGTLFLDEIGELPLAAQAKLLRVLEERTFERIGGSTTLRSQARMVAATNQDLRRLVEEGRFRADLLFRLEVFPLDLPPLRERRSDIPAIARHLLVAKAERLERPVPQLTPDAVAWLERGDWPGNVRAVANLIERALVVLEPDRPWSAVDLESLHGATWGSAASAQGQGQESPARRGHPGEPSTASTVSRDQLIAALLAADGDKHLAARALSCSLRTVQRLVRDLDLEGFPRYRDRGSLG